MMAEKKTVLIGFIMSFIIQTRYLEQNYTLHCCGLPTTQFIVLKKGCFAEVRKAG